MCVHYTRKKKNKQQRSIISIRLKKLFIHVLYCSLDDLIYIYYVAQLHILFPHNAYSEALLIC